MMVIVCLDDKNGMAFNKRRQSTDEEVIKDILKNAGQKIWISSYSVKLFGPFDTSRLIIEEDFLDCSKSGDCCFVENRHLGGLEDKIEDIIIYHWNRVYPADLYFDIDLKTDKWELISTKEFRGKSHDKITKETYRHKA